MADSTQCPGCGEQYSVPAEFAGKRVKCKKCGGEFQIPVSGEAVEARGPHGLESPTSPPSDPLSGEPPVAALAGSPEEEARSVAVEGRCPHCGDDCVGGVACCRSCGRRIADFIACPACKEPIARDATHCPFCTQTVPSDQDIAARSLQLTVRATKLGAFLTGGGVTGLLFPPIISVSQGRIRVTRWTFLGLRVHDQEIQVSRVASVRYTKGIIWGGLLVETFGGASEDLSEKGLRQEDASNMANRLKAVLSDRM